MKRVFLDYNSTTPIAHEVFEAMGDCFFSDFGNPSSTHFYGREAKKNINVARTQVANLIAAEASEIVFCSGGTEANNLAIWGVVNSSNGKVHIVTSQVEHSSVHNVCKELESLGHTVSYLSVDENGLIDMNELENALSLKPALVTLAYSNSETGVMQNIEQVCVKANKHKVPVHIDAVQAAGKLAIDVDSLGVSMMSLSAHKMYGPKGIGALYVKKGFNLTPQFFGGGQEKNRRSGTENVPGIVGMGKACELAKSNLKVTVAHMQSLRDCLEQEIVKTISCAKINGEGAPRVCNTTNISFKGMESDTLLMKLDLKGVAVSAGSACSSGVQSGSRVLSSMGVSAVEVNSALRFSVGVTTTAEEIDYVIAILQEVTK